MLLLLPKIFKLNSITHFLNLVIRVCGLILLKKLKTLKNYLFFSSSLPLNSYNIFHALSHTHTYLYIFSMHNFMLHIIIIIKCIIQARRFISVAKRPWLFSRSRSASNLAINSLLRSRQINCYLVMLHTTYLQGDSVEDLSFNV